MKKFIMCCPIQPEGHLNAVKYKTSGNEKLVYDKETRFPVIPMINGYAENGEKIEVILIQSDNANTDINRKYLEDELEALSKEKNISYDIKTVKTAYKEDIDTQLELFGDAISLINDGDTLYICNTYGTKPTPIIQTMVANYAYRALENVFVECIVYGQFDHSTKESTIFDITALFYMDEVVNNLAKMKVKNPSEKIRTILDL